jgi:hypothetical protein
LIVSFGDVVLQTEIKGNNAGGDGVIVGVGVFVRVGVGVGVLVFVGVGVGVMVFVGVGVLVFVGVTVLVGVGVGVLTSNPVKSQDGGIVVVGVGV